MTDNRVLTVSDRALAAAIGLLVCSACNPQPDQARTKTPAPLLQVTESEGPAWKDDAWQIAAEPSVKIDREGDPRYEFTRIISASRFTDGRIVLANFDRPPEIRIYQPSGEHLVTFGRSGAGPGEFKAISWVDARPGDHDPGLRLLVAPADLFRYARPSSAHPDDRGDRQRVVHTLRAEGRLCRWLAARIDQLHNPTERWGPRPPPNPKPTHPGGRNGSGAGHHRRGSRCGVLDSQGWRDSVQVWSVFDAGGRYLGPIRIPRALRIVHIGRDDVLGIWTDELGIETARVHPIKKQ